MRRIWNIHSYSKQVKVNFSGDSVLKTLNGDVYYSQKNHKLVAKRKPSIFVGI